MKTLIYQKNKIAFNVEGQGTPLVLLHGFCEDSRIWEEFAPLINDCKIISIDLPGFGQSDLPLEQSIPKMADFVKAVLDDLKITKCIMIGHSMGGYVSLAFAKKYESYLLGLSLLHSHPYEDTEAGKTNRVKSIDFIERNNHFLYIKQLFPKLFNPSFASNNKFLMEKLIHYAISYSPEAIKATLKAMLNRPDETKTLSKLSCPILFIIGKKDTLIPIEKSLEQSYLPSVSSIQVLPKVGHMGMFEAPKKIAKSINQFVSYCNLFSENLN